ncbi:hypothetical protein ACFLYM_00545 [Chloroflexota bacterium]
MRGKTSGAVIDRIQEKPVCSHHWLIETADKPTSRGVCKYCGAAKEFSNIFYDSVPKDDDFSQIGPIDSDDNEDDNEGNAELQVGLSENKSKNK